ncbi:RNA polymerase recycling motor HelD [Niallia sp. 03133]|uniref:RNA polymerase recycling motor HelD n=1 Tax=Niallia sp. 03133 TaxID=3458060 RepID=UPI004044B143
MSEQKKEEIILEESRVQKVIKEIDEKIKKYIKASKLIGVDASQLRRTFWEDVTVNFDESDDIAETYASIKQQAELLGERERSYGQLHNQMNTLTKLKNSPYFGRIDFKERDEEQEEIYIGIASLMDKEEQNFYIYDWRAPISSVYYDYSPGPANYQTPEGKIEGELLLKRQFIIREGKIISLFDTGVTIGDELLLEVLGNNATALMKSIVATIQKEQNKIIRNDSSKVLIVQGVAGSGKTSAALQRVAYLMYRHRQTLTSDNIMLFSPNPLFNSYVSTVLPELGEENMQQSTFQEYIVSRIGSSWAVEDPFSQLEVLLSEENQSLQKMRLKSIQYKSSLAFKKNLDTHLAQLASKGILFKNIAFRNKVLFSKEELTRKFYEWDTSLPLANRLQLLKEWVQKEMKVHAKQERKQSWVEEEMQLLDKEEFLEAYRASQKKSDEFSYFNEEEQILRKLIVNKRFKKIYKRIKTLRFVDYGAMYQEAFQHDAPSILTEQEWMLIQANTLNAIKNKQLWNEDGTAFAYFKDKMEGKKSSTSMKHVFIDEAQDYSPFQMEYIKELFPYSKLTLLGDVNQAIYAHENNEWMQSENSKEIEQIVLTKSYRSTREIVEFTKGLAEKGEMIEPFNRNGEKPVVREVANVELFKKEVLRELRQLKNKGYETSAVICKTKKESERVYGWLKKHIDVRLIEKGTVSYEKGISIIPAYLAKGIEFDGVIIYNSSLYTNHLEKELFYTACTRAMHELVLFSESGKRNSFLKNINKNTYHIVEADEQIF